MRFIKPPRRHADHGRVPPQRVAVHTIPHPKRLTPAQWHQIEVFLDQWKADVLSAAKRHPARSYKLGREQIEAFGDLLASVSGVAPALSHFGGTGPTMEASVSWGQRYLLRELEDTLNVYVGKLKDELLYGLRQGLNPAAVASRLFDVTQRATVNWRTVARTEMARASAAGRLDACEAMGFDQVWVPPHAGSCKYCREVLENKVFSIAQLRDATNFGRAAADWVPCCPLHPNCRHGYLPYDPEVFAEAQRQYAAMGAAGLMDDDNLDEWFDSSGQLKPEYSHIDFSAAKSHDCGPGCTHTGPMEYGTDVYAEGLAVAVWKVISRRRGVVAKTRPNTQWIPADDLRVDLYQRAWDPDKVMAMLAQLRRGEQLPPPEISHRDDGTYWIVDGQHRVQARRLNGEPSIECRVRDGLSWGEEAEQCRAAIHKLYEDPLEAVEKAEQPRAPKGTSAGGEWIKSKVAAMPAADAKAKVRVPRGDGYLKVHDLDALDHALKRHKKRKAFIPTEDALKGRREKCEHCKGPVRPADADTVRGSRGVRGDWKPGHGYKLRHYDCGLHATLTQIAEDPDSVGPSGGLGNFAGPVRKAMDTLDAVLEPPAESHSYPTPALNPALFDGLRLDDLVELALTTWWDRVAGDRADEYSTLFVPAHGGPVRVVVDYDRMRAARPDYKRLADTDLHLALCLAARRASDGAEIAPGVPLDVRIVPGHLDDVAGPAWEIGASRWIGGEPVGIAKTADVDWSLTSAGDQSGLLDLSLADRLRDEPVAKADKGDGDKANVGVEHWITIHPHGEDAKGQPVLVRNNADGTMSVIGGAGGNLNYLRLDPKRRIKDGQKAKGGKVEQQVSREEAEASAAEREQEVGTARDQLAKANELRDAKKAELHGFLRDELGHDLEGLDPKARQKMLAKIRTAAVRTLAYGEIAKRDTQDGASRDELGLDAPDAPKGWEADPASSEGEESEQGPPRPSMALTAEQASAILDYHGELRAIGKIAGAQRKVIGGEQNGSAANQIDWSLGGDTEKDRRRHAQVEATIRSDLARQLLSTLDSGSVGHKRSYERAVVQGGYDAIDSFAHSILGHSVMSKEASALLGVAGSAQLVAHHIQAKAKELGKQGLDLDKVAKSLDELTAEHESEIVDRGLNRARVATERAAEAYGELQKSEAGDSLYTTTMIRSTGAAKLQEAGRALGMMISGLEAKSSLRTNLQRPMNEKIKVGGFSSPARIKELAAKARVKLNDGDIVRVGAGNYTLAVAPEKLEHLIRPTDEGNKPLRDRLMAIRTGQGLKDEVEAARSTPGMSDTLDANQAKGKLFLQAAGSGLLAFDPGVGKTHVAIAAAMEKMHNEPDAGHRALIVAPTNMLRSWANTIKSQGSGHTVSIVGAKAGDDGRDESDAKKKQAALTSGAHFTIVSYETLKTPGMQKALKEHEGRGHSIVVADELQKAKDDKTKNYSGIEGAIDRARDDHGEGAAFWGLTGTPVEKSIGDVHSMRRLVNRAKGTELEDRKTYAARHGKAAEGSALGNDHIARGDKVRQFRQGLDEDLFRLSARDAGNDLAEPKRKTHEVKLDPAHEKSFKERVGRLNAMIADAADGVKTGRYDKEQAAKKRPSFGGRDAMMDELYGREDSALVKKAAAVVGGLGTFDFKGAPEAHSEGNYAKGDHAGTYHHKAVVFGANETSRALFGASWNASAKEDRKKGGLHAELEAQGHKVFIGHGSMKSSENEASYKAFLAHDGPATFLTNDKNNAGISLQFGDNKGAFQHGATHMIHFTRPVNNATIQQREARIHRKGAWSTPTYHQITANTPIEQRLQETLDNELKTQDLAANSESQVAGGDTLHHHLTAHGALGKQ